VEVCWYRCSSSKERCEELRKVAETEIKARVKKAQMAITEASVSAQEAILSMSLSSAGAQMLLDSCRQSRNCFGR
jgi:hypothetical protein